MRSAVRRRAVPGSIRWTGWFVALYGLMLGLAGLLLVLVGGTSYYLLAGIGTAAAGGFASKGRAPGVWIYLAVFVGSVVWAVGETGFRTWTLAPRLGMPLVIGLIILTPWLIHRGLACRFGAAALVAGVIVAGGWLALASRHHDAPHHDTPNHDTHSAQLAERILQASDATEWTSFANGLDGLRFSHAAEIAPGNVGRLKVAWTYRTGEDPTRLSNPRNLPTFQATPIKVGPLLYLCTPRNQVIALDAETGRERWRYDPKTDVSGDSYLLACRGVSYLEVPSSQDHCARRIIAATLDGRLIALDARTGQPCEEFGERGTVSLTRNLGPIQSGQYGVTSAPLVAGGVIVVGAQVLDNQGMDVPSGVIRAFAGDSGRQLWAFDTGAIVPTEIGEPPQDRIYTRGSPNAWAPFSADVELGLVYVPTGNAAPDYFAAPRNPAMRRFGSSVLAIELHSGQLRWSFQTVHHDVWDYDIGAQPLLTEMKIGDMSIPVLIQPTKRGDLFVLDRRTGEPVVPVEERAVPQRGVHDESLSPTQPISVGMPFLGPTPRTEAAMWGVTPFDQIWCRVQFHRLRYEGPFTPPSTDRSLQSPNQTGASNWGRASIDPARGLLVANTINLDSIVQLIPRREVDAAAADGLRPIFPQMGTPYAASFRNFLSPLGIPCNEPPWGEIRAIDLSTRTTLWRKPLGTVRDRMPIPLAFELGVPNVGGPLTTASGLTFIAAADDGYLRAYASGSGRLLWSTRLPASAQSAPMTFVSGETGRQFVVIAAGGDRRLGSRPGDYVIAFSLPDDDN